MTKKMLISGIPDNLERRFKAVIPTRQRSKFLLKLIEKEVEKREHELYECAKRVEEDSALQQDLQIWNEAIEDGLSDDPSLNKNC